jgi:hypothetical protein
MPRGVSPSSTQPSTTAEPITTTPAKAIVLPTTSWRGKPSRSSRPASTAIMIGPTLMSMAAVPASTRRSAALSATL